MLKKLSQEKDFKEGKAFSLKTCDSFDPITLKEHNAHTELWLVHKRNKDSVVMMSFDDGRKVKYEITKACFLFEVRNDL